MKKITKSRISYIFGIVAIVCMNILMVSLNNHLTDPHIKHFTYLIMFGSLVVIGLYVNDLLKYSTTVKNEKILLLKNRIKFHEKEIERYKELIEQTEKDY